MMAAQKARAVSLAALVGDLANCELPEMSVTGISQLAGEATPGCMFLALSGASRHGLSFVDEALARGAAVVAWEPTAGMPPPEFPAGIVGIEVPALRAATGLIADRFFGAPSADMQIAGITGTNGKTSTAFFVAQAVEALGLASAVIGTLGSGRPGALDNATLTTPDAVNVHRTLAAMRTNGVRHVAMEVSSHALVQGRVNAVRFDCAAFTNLSRDHLDYHPDMDAYAAAKLQLFTRHHPRCAVINCTDSWGEKIRQALSAEVQCIQVVAEDDKPAKGEWLTHRNIDAHDDGITFQVEGSFGSARLHSQLVGDFNASNLLVALGILLVWGFSLRRAVQALEKVRAPAGRMETFRNAAGPLVIVDYAHSPDALEKVLLAARAHARGKLSVVFGCGGERDAGKRPQMGAIACRLADEVWVTDDNPRNEDPDEIVADIMSGDGVTARIERDRAAAIEGALNAAAEGDVVVIAGKGHEAYQITAGGRQPFSDREVVSGLLGAAVRASGVQA